MNPFLRAILPVNSITLVGVIFLIFGFLLLPFLIGFPLMMIGSILIFVGVMKHLLKLLPFGKKIENYVVSFCEVFKNLLRKTG